MENMNKFMQEPEMLAMLEQLKKDIDADIERRKMAYSVMDDIERGKISYIGKDGKDYLDKQSLDAANKLYIQTMYTFIGKDGFTYSTSEGLEAANKRYDEYIYPNEDSKGFRR